MSNGLGNVGNTCGLNALLQCIAHTECLRDYFLKTAPDGKIEEHNKYSIVNELKRLLQEFWVGDSSIIPVRFAKAFEEATKGRIAMGEQLDMSELLLVLLDKFEKEWQKSNAVGVGTQLPWPHSQGASTSQAYQSMVKLASEAWHRFMAKVPASWARLMNGLQVGQVVCDNESCRHIYHNFEPFSVLSLDIPTTKPEGKMSIHLGDCFKAYFDPELLDGCWKCDKCGGTKAEKLSRFWSAPEVLVVVLKRFKYRPNGTLEKIHVPFDIPEFFSFLPGTEISKTHINTESNESNESTGKESRYQLRAIGCHFGSLNRGHYTALAKHNGKWWHFDDLSVNQLENQEMALKNNMHAYMLFYERANAVV